MSLKDIANLANTSVSTVSRVLSGETGCASAELRERIWKSVQETGYVPDISAKNLRKGKSKEKPLKAAIVLSRIHSLDVDPFFRELYGSVREELLKKGYSSVRVDAVEGGAPDIQGANAIIVLGRCSAETLRKLKAMCENIVGIWRNPMDFDIDEVVCDGKKAAAVAVEYLIARGFKNIAYIGDCSYESRYVGYCDTLIRHDMPINYPLITPTNQTEAEGYGAMEAVMKKGGVDAVFCANDITAVGVLRAMKDFGLKKNRIAVISIDDIDLAQKTEPLLTTIRVPIIDMAHMAVNVLDDRVKRGHREITRVEFPCRLVRRDSCFERAM